MREHPARATRGFSLVELAAAVLVAAIIAAIGVTTYSTFIFRTERRSADTTLRSVEDSAVELAANGSPADFLDDALSDPPEDLPGDVELYAVAGDGTGAAPGMWNRLVYADSERLLCRTLIVLDDGSQGPIWDADCDDPDRAPVVPSEVLTPPPAPAVGLSEPTGLSAVPSATERRIDLSWSAPAGAPAGVSYRVWTRPETSTGPWSVVGVSGSTDYTVQGADPGVTSQYAVSAFTTLRESDRSASVLGTSNDTAPSPPSGLTLTASAASVRVSWTPSPSGDVTHTVVRRGNGTCSNQASCPGLVDVAPVDHPGSSYTDTSVSPGSTYTYWAVAVDQGDLEGSSTPATVTAEANNAVARPVGLAWTQEGNGVRLTWKEPGSAAPGDTYRVFRDGSVIATVSGTGPDQARTHLDPGPLTQGRTYAYSVVTVRGSTTSSPAGPVHAVTTDQSPPAAPTGFTVSLTADGTPEARWTRSVSTDVVRYELWRRSESPSPSISGWHPVATVSQAASLWRDDDPLELEAARYRIRAVDADGLASSWVQSPSTVTAPDRTRPEPPEAILAGPVQEAIAIGWDPSDFAPGDLAGYTVERLLSDLDDATAEDSFDFPAQPPYACDPSQVPNPPDTTGFPVEADYPICFTDDGVDFGVDYFYRVRAYDSAGNVSAWVGLAEATPADTIAPAPPTGLSGEELPGEADLTWTLSASDDVVEYYIEARAAGYDTVARTLDATQTDVTLQLHAQPNWQVTLIAIDKAGNQSEPAQTTVNVYDPDLLPPTDFRAIGRQDDGIRIRWTHSPSDTRGRRYALLRNGSLIATVTGTLYDDTSAQFGVDYSYSIRTIDDFSRQSILVGPVTSTPGDITPPDPPTNMTVTPQDHALRVQITGHSPSTDVTDYLLVLYRDDNGQELSRVTVPRGSAIHVFTGLIGGDSYTIHAFAIDRGGNRSSSPLVRTGVPNDPDV